jgi:hypothetical protein
MIKCEFCGSEMNDDARRTAHASRMTASWREITDVWSGIFCGLIIGLVLYKYFTQNNHLLPYFLEVK